MSIRFKVIGALALLFAALSVAAFLIQLRVVQPSFARLQQATARTAMKRVQYAMDRDLQSLEIDATDWANWQEAYRFAQGRNPKFVAMNFTHTAIAQVQIDSILVVDPKGRVLAWTGDVVPTQPVASGQPGERRLPAGGLSPGGGFSEPLAWCMGSSRPISG